MSKDARLLAKIAAWYYIENMNQEDIARRTRLSRSTISRMLQRARDEGVVSIKVNLPDVTESFLERRLEETFGIKEAVVTSRADDDDIPMVLGRAAASYLYRILQPGDRIGLTWGDTVAETVKALPQSGLRDLTCVQLAGALGATRDPGDAAESVRILASRADSRAYLLHAPYYVESYEDLQAMRSMPVLARTMEKWQELNLAIVSIGALDPNFALPRYGPEVAEMIRQGRARGAVGEVCGHLFDGRDNLDIVLPGHVPVGMPLDQLKQVDHVIGISGGTGHAPSIFGALTHHLLDVLVTDAPTARALLDLAGQPHNSTGAGLSPAGTVI